MRLEQKIAIVTGATQGLGADIAQALVKEGAHVILVGRSKEAGQAVAADINTKTRTDQPLATFFEADITSDQAIDACVKLAVQRFGRIDILVNNACSYADEGLASPRELWFQTLNVNLISAAIFTQKAAPHIPRGGVVINLGSVGGKFGSRRAIYSASKAALLQITRNFAVTLAPQGIRVLSVSPAWTWSPSTARMSNDSPSTADAVGAALHPLGRIGRGAEVGSVIAFLASEDARWMTGADVPVDGGFSALGPDQGAPPSEWFARFNAEKIGQ